MISRPLRLAALTGALALAPAATATASITLGSTGQPANSNASACGTGRVIAQASSDPSTPVGVPTLGGMITQWQMSTIGSSPGSPVTFVVLRPGSGGNYAVVATDTRTLPNPSPTNGVATFDLASPIAVAGGETLGLYTNSASGPVCYWHDGSTPSADTLAALNAGNPPAGGQTLSPAMANSPPGYTMNLAATLVIDQDAGVSAAAVPSSASLGSVVLLGWSVTSAGPNGGAITFTDDVPAGLTVQSALSGSGTCGTAGQHVTCTIGGLAPGQSAPVDVLVTPVMAGSYADTASVSTSAGVDDPNPGNNTASVTLMVRDPTTCTVPPLAATPLVVAERVLGLLGCRVARVSSRHSRTFPRRTVIATAPGAGVYAAGTTVNLTISSGPPAPPRSHRRATRHSRHQAAKRTRSKLR